MGIDAWGSALGERRLGIGAWGSVLACASAHLLVALAHARQIRIPMRKVEGSAGELGLCAVASVRPAPSTPAVQSTDMALRTAGGRPTAHGTGMLAGITC